LVLVVPEPDASTLATKLEAVEYVRRVYDDVLGWYHSADTKAQVLLGLDGAFLAFLAAATFQKTDDLEKLVESFSPWTSRLLFSMSVTLVLSMLAAVYCLWSRISFASSLDHVIENARTPARRRSEYPPDVMWFFQHLAVLDPDRLRQTLAHVDSAFELNAMASQLEKLSSNVRKKHIAVDLGFGLALTTLVLFAGAAASYLVGFLGPR
jgi:hypothetical protein